MYPIAIVLGVGLAIALERFAYLMNQMRVNRRDYEKILPLLNNLRIEEQGTLVNASFAIPIDVMVGLMQELHEMENGGQQQHDAAPVKKEKKGRRQAL